MMLPRQFSTTIFSATQRSNIDCYIVSTGCNTVSALQRLLRCGKNRRCESSGLPSEARRSGIY